MGYKNQRKTSLEEIEKLLANDPKAGLVMRQLREAQEKDAQARAAYEKKVAAGKEVTVRGPGGPQTRLQIGTKTVNGPNGPYKQPIYADSAGVYGSANNIRGSSDAVTTTAFGSGDQAYSFNPDTGDFWSAQHTKPGGFGKFLTGTLLPAAAMATGAAGLTGGLTGAGKAAGGGSIWSAGGSSALPMGGITSGQAAAAGLLPAGVKAGGMSIMDGLGKASSIWSPGGSNAPPMGGVQSGGGGVQSGGGSLFDKAKGVAGNIANSGGSGMGWLDKITGAFANFPGISTDSSESSSEPWAGHAPYLADVWSQAQQQFNNPDMWPGVYQGQRVADLSPTTSQGIDMIKDQGFWDQAMNPARQLTQGIPGAMHGLANLQGVDPAAAMQAGQAFMSPRRGQVASGPSAALQNFRASGADPRLSNFQSPAAGFQSPAQGFQAGFGGGQQMMRSRQGGYDPRMHRSPMQGGGMQGGGMQAQGAPPARAGAGMAAPGGPGGSPGGLPAAWDGAQGRQMVGGNRQGGYDPRMHRGPMGGGPGQVQGGPGGQGGPMQGGPMQGRGLPGVNPALTNFRAPGASQGLQNFQAPGVNQGLQNFQAGGPGQALQNYQTTAFNPSGSLGGLEALQSAARGDYLPGQEGANPYLDDTYDMAARRMNQNYEQSVLPGLNATFANAGRSYGGAHGLASGRAAEGHSQSLQDLSTRMYGNAYETERGRQMQAAGMLGDQRLQGDAQRLSAQQHSDSQRLGQALGMSDHALRGQGLNLQAATEAGRQGLQGAGLNLQALTSAGDQNLRGAGLNLQGILGAGSQGLQAQGLNLQAMLGAGDQNLRAMLGSGDQNLRAMLGAGDQNLQAQGLNLQGMLGAGDQRLRAQGMNMQDAQFADNLKLQSGLGAAGIMGQNQGRQLSALQSLLGAGTSGTGMMSNLLGQQSQALLGAGQLERQAEQQRLDAERMKWEQEQNQHSDALNRYAQVVFGANPSQSTSERSGWGLS